MSISRYREPASLFGLQRLNRILDEAFFPEQGNVITSTWFAPTDDEIHAAQSGGAG